MSLLKAFKQAGIPTSTYYRTINSRTELRYFTAIKVMTEIEKLYSLERARSYTRELRESGGRVDTRDILFAAVLFHPAWALEKHLVAVAARQS